MKRSLVPAVGVGLLLVACGDSPDSGEHYTDIESLIEAYESEGGKCVPDGEPEFSDYGEAIRCESGVMAFRWDQPADTDSVVSEEVEEAVRLSESEERFYVASSTWAFSVAGQDSAEWIQDHLGGEILLPASAQRVPEAPEGTVIVTVIPEPEVKEVEPPDMDERRAVLEEREDEISSEEESLEERSGDLDAREAELDEREEAVAATELEIEENTIPGSGMYLVGEDIEPGTYFTDSDRCYWARLSGFSGGISDIVSNGNTRGPTYVTIAPTDTAFETNRCVQWVRQ